MNMIHYPQKEKEDVNNYKGYQHLIHNYMALFCPGNALFFFIKS